MLRIARRNAAVRGFTLLEMLIVVALVGLMVAIAIPNFTRMLRISRVSRSANRVALGITRARSVALRRARPVLIKVNVTATNLQFMACLDSNFATTPGADSTTFACDGGDLGVGATGGLTQQESPFGNESLLSVNNTVTRENDVSLGFPAATNATYTACPSNLGTTTGCTAPVTGVFWFGFNSAGTLIPDGRTPFVSTLDLTQMTRNPSTVPSAANPNGPEFYFAEPSAASNNGSPSSHVYRKIELSPLGAVRVMSWDFRANDWIGIQAQ